MALDIKKFIARFVEEARDHIIRLGEGLDALERNPAEREIVHTVFRSVHTLKGSSRMLKLSAITDTAHKLEDVLDAMREGRLAYTAELGSLLYRAVDALAGLIERVAEGGAPPDADEALCNALTAALSEKNAAGADEAQRNPGTPETSHETTRIDGVRAAPALPITQDTVRVKMNKLDELIKLMGEVVSSHARSRQRLIDIREIERETGDAANDRKNHKSRLRSFALALRDDVLAQELLMNELHDKALIMRMLPLAIVFDPVGRMMRELAHSVGKEVECVISGAEIELDRQLIDKLSDPVVHLLRNALDHGIEAPDVRQAAGKPGRGRITLSANQDGGWVVIEISDDGGGIPLQALREKAVRKGLLTQEKAAGLSEQETIDLIFLPGFSTSPIITDISGRGVGMDVVKRSIVDDLHGIISVDNRPGAGATFALRLPLSLAMMRVLLVEAGGIPFGFTARYVAELLRVPQDEFLTVAQRRVAIIRNEFVPIVPLDNLLRIPLHYQRKTARKKKPDGVLLLVVRAHSEKLALIVDDLLDERDMVIKPLPEHLRHLAMVSGMVTTGKNELVNILHVPELLEMARREHDAALREQTAMPEANGARLHLLVVDDSLNTREIEKDVLEAHGYRVTLAEDGQDGLRKAQADKFDAILTDVEMPVMDGFTLTERLRQEDNYRNTPIIIITSREKEEDKRRGIRAGADAYIVKGDFDRNKLVDTLRYLLG